MIPIHGKHYEPINQIPAHSLIELPDGQRLHFRGVQHGKYGHHAHDGVQAQATVSRPFEQETWFLSHTQLARFCCQIADYHAVGSI